ncbi:hypothetical protein Apmu_0187_02 [Acidiphilium multivorum AIU301]|nr:hypothetical protein Apmu_0187_02 [Acidiphilium multivorum AIU301]
MKGDKLICQHKIVKCQPFFGMEYEFLSLNADSLFSALEIPPEVREDQLTISPDGSTF